MKKGVAWILLITDNYIESLNFYKDILGFKIKREVKEEEFCQFSLQNCFLAIYGRSQLQKLLSPQHLGKAGGAIYSFPESKDIDTDCKVLKEKGVHFIKEPATQPWGQRTAYFTDPDGHIWEVQQWLKKEAL